VAIWDQLVWCKYQILVGILLIFTYCLQEGLNFRGVTDNSLPGQEGNKLLRPNSGLIQILSTKLDTLLSLLLYRLQATQKKSEFCLFNEDSTQQWYPCRKKLRIFLSYVQWKGDSPMGQDTENWVGDHDIGSTGRAVSSVLQMPGVFVQVQYFLAVLHVELFFQKIFANCSSRDE